MIINYKTTLEYILNKPQEYKEKLLAQSKQESETVDYDSLEEREERYKEYFNVISLPKDNFLQKISQKKGLKSYVIGSLLRNNSTYRHK